MPFKQRLALLTVSLMTLAACSSVKLDEAPPPAAPIDSRGGQLAETIGKGATASAIESSGTGDRQLIPTELPPTTGAQSDPASLLAKASIYFDFDQYTIRDEFKATLEAHARFLLANPNRKIIIQGNTDERGSREYNLALGQRRAEAVRKALQALGVPEGQMEPVSLGEEKPRTAGSDDAAQAENRRADLIYQ